MCGSTLSKVSEIAWGAFHGLGFVDPQREDWNPGRQEWSMVHVERCLEAHARRTE